MRTQHTYLRISPTNQAPTRHGQKGPAARHTRRRMQAASARLTRMKRFPSTRSNDVPTDVWRQSATAATPAAGGGWHQGAIGDALHRCVPHRRTGEAEELLWALEKLGTAAQEKATDHQRLPSRQAEQLHRLSGSASRRTRLRSISIQRAHLEQRESGISNRKPACPDTAATRTLEPPRQPMNRTGRPARAPPRQRPALTGSGRQRRNRAIRGAAPPALQAERRAER